MNVTPVYINQISCNDKHNNLQTYK